MQEKDDFAMALEALEDEYDGVVKYSEMFEVAECSQLRKIFGDAHEAEKQHATALLNWITSKAKSVL
jgi:hypothetical protein